MKTFLMMLLVTLPMFAQETNIEQPSGFSATPAGGKFLHWYGKLGRTYFPQNSSQAEPLYKWEWAPVIETGKNETISHQITSAAPRGFFRLQYTDLPIPAGKTADTADFDNDDLKNYVEITNIPQTDPLNPDTDGDGLPDGWEVAHGLNATNSSDANNLFLGSNNMTNLQAFQSGVQGNPNITSTDRDGDSLNDLEDADPNDRYVDWPPVAESSYAVFQLGSLANNGYHQIMMNSSGAVFHHQTIPSTVPSVNNVETVRIWKNGTWSNNISATYTAYSYDGNYSFPAPGSVTEIPNFLCGNYLYRSVPIYLCHELEHWQWNTLRWNATSLPVSSHDSIIDIGNTHGITSLAPGTGYEPFSWSNNLSNADGVLVRNKIKTPSGSIVDPPIPCVWFPPAGDPNSSSYIPGDGSPSLQLPAGYGVTAMDASGAVIANSYANGSTAYTLFDQGSRTPLPNEIAGSRTLGRVTFGTNNEQSRLLIGGGAVKSNGAIHMRQVIPFGGNGWVTAIANNGVLLGREPISTDPNSQATRSAIWRNGKAVALDVLVEAETVAGTSVAARSGSLSALSMSASSSMSRYTNLEGLTMNDSGAIVATADDKLNPSTQHKTLVALLPIQVVSRDKFLAGSFQIPASMDDLELEFSGHENLGRYGNLLGGGTTKIFDNVEQILNAPDNAENEQPENQQVWFVRDSADPRKIHFYTCYSTIGEAEIRIHFNNGSSAEAGRVPHTLKEAADFSSIIAYVDRWVKGTSFSGTWANTSWLAMNTTALEGDIANQARACLIPFFDIIDQVTGFTPLVMGLCDGVRKGYDDDKAFLSLMFNGVVQSQQWLYETSKAELDRWTLNPIARENELKKILFDLCKNVVLPHMAELGESFTTWDGFKNHAWNMWSKVRKLDEMLRVVPMESVHLLNDALIEWGNNFASRMMTGAEKAAWDNVGWDFSPMLSAVEANRNIAFYTFGYTFGYIGEQCVTAVLSAGTVTVGKICAKNGINMISKVAPRAVAVLAMRFHYIKQALTDFNLMDNELRLAYESMMSSAAREPTTPLIKEIAASRMESRMANTAFTRTTFNFQEFIKTALKDGNVRKLIKSPGGRDIFSKRTSQLMHLLGDECDAITMKNFMKAAEDRVVVVHPDGTVDEFFEGFFRAFEGNSSLMANLDDPLHSIAGYSDGAKARLKFFLSDPDAGNLWKLDDYAPGDTESWKRYITRGVLGELDAYKRVYKPQGYGHSPTAAGFDFTGSKWVQVKTCKSPGTTQNIADMKTAIDDLIDKSPSTAPLKLHILKKPGTDSVALETALADYKALDTETRGRVQIVIEAYNIGPE